MKTTEFKLWLITLWSVALILTLLHLWSLVAVGLEPTIAYWVVLAGYMGRDCSLYPLVQEAVVMCTHSRR